MLLDPPVDFIPSSQVGNAVSQIETAHVYRGDGLNLYAYWKNNPVVYYGPSGCNQKPCKEDASTDEGRSGAVGSTEWSGDKEIYSVAYEVKLPDNMYPEVSDGRRFQECNRQLYNVFNKDIELEQMMETLYPEIIQGV